MQFVCAPLQILEKMKTLRLMVVGDAMLDSFTYGTVSRVSPEAPIPVLASGKAVVVPGGAGNAVANLAGLGCAVTLVSVAGDDEARGELDAALRASGAVDPVLVVDPARPTIRKNRFVANGQQILRVDDEIAKPVSGATEDAIIAAIEKQASSCGAIIVSDYGKGVVTPRVLDAVMKTGLPVFVDPKGYDYARYKGARCITPNLKELAEATGGMSVATDDDVVAAARAVLKTSGAQAVLAKRSEKGMTLVQRDGEPVHLPAQAREVFDVSGAGDTVIAVLAASVAAGADAADAARLANIAAGLVVEKRGTSAITHAMLRSVLANTAPRGRTLAPVMSWDDARAQMDEWKKQGLSVGFTNGCFDILHQGHVMMLDRCRAYCDRLVLGLNVDSSVKRLKGAERPVNNQDARACVVAALGSIDAVVFFGENLDEGDTPLALITALLPDVMFKGKDYTIDKVIGADVVMANGGRVELIDLEDGFSTTGTIAALAGKTGKKMGSAA